MSLGDDESLVEGNSQFQERLGKNGEYEYKVGAMPWRRQSTGTNNN
jgi:hypothetical protein